MSDGIETIEHSLCLGGCQSPSAGIFGSFDLHTIPLDTPDMNGKVNDVITWAFRIDTRCRRLYCQYGSVNIEIWIVGEPVQDEGRCRKILITESERCGRTARVGHKNTRLTEVSFPRPEENTLCGFFNTSRG